jgi:hypothetical protein
LTVADHKLDKITLTGLVDRGEVRFAGRMRRTGVLILIGVVLAFGIPLVRLAIPGGERGPDTVEEALVKGLFIALALPVIILVKRKMRSGALRAGKDLRAKREARSHD